MTLIFLILTTIWFEVVANDSGYTVPQPLHPFGVVGRTSGAAVFHIAKTNGVKPVSFQGSSLDVPLKSLTAPSAPIAPLTFSAEKLKRHPGVHVTTLPHKENSDTKLHAAPYHSRGKIDQEESNIRKAPEWVEHFPTHSRHKFSIQNLGQSEEVMRQFYKGANGGKPYTTPKPNVETLKAKKNVFNGEKERRIAENIIKEELNRAKVAKFGRSAGAPPEGNESGTDEEPTGAAVPLTVEESGYSNEVKTVNVDWSVNNNKVEEFFHGYDGLSALPARLPPTISNNLPTNNIKEDRSAVLLYVSTATSPVAISTTAPTGNTPVQHKGCAAQQELTSPEESAPPSQVLSNVAPSGPREIQYPLPKSVDGAVTGHAGKSDCPPCALLFASPPPSVALTTATSLLHGESATITASESLSRTPAPVVVQTASSPLEPPVEVAPLPAEASASSSLAAPPPPAAHSESFAPERSVEVVPSSEPAPVPVPPPPAPAQSESSPPETPEGAVLPPAVVSAPSHEVASVSAPLAPAAVQPKKSQFEPAENCSPAIMLTSDPHLATLPPAVVSAPCEDASVSAPLAPAAVQPEKSQPGPAVEVAPAVMPTSDQHEYSHEQSPVHVPAQTSAPHLAVPAVSSIDHGPVSVPQSTAPEVNAPYEEEASKEEIAPVTVAESIQQQEIAPVSSLSQREPAPAPSVSPPPTSSNVYTGGDGAHIAPAVVRPPAPVAPALSPSSSAPSQSLPPQAGNVDSAYTAPTLLPASTPSYSAIPSVSEETSYGDSHVPVSSNTYAVGSKEAPAPSQILPAQPGPTEHPAPAVPVVVTTTQPAFVQQPESNSAESSYTNLEEDHVESQVASIPAPVAASTYKEVNPSYQPDSAPGPSVESTNYQTSKEVLPVESYEENAEVAPVTAPEPELRPEAIIHPATTTETVTTEGRSQYINASPSHISDQSYSGTSQQVSYVPEAAPSISEEPEPQEPPTSKAEPSSYNNLEEDHDQDHGPETIIDTENTGNAPQKYQEVKKPAHNTRPRIQVNPAAYKSVQPYAPRPYVPRPLPPQSVAQYKESFIPRLQPLPPPAPSPVSVPLFPPSPPAPYFPSVPPFQTYPQQQAPVFHQVPAPSYPAPQSQQGCCGGQLVSSQGNLCVPANFNPCGGSQSQQFQSSNGGCGVCSPTCTSACQVVVNQGCGSGDCCTLRSPSCCQPMQSLCCNQVVQSCCQPQQQTCCNAQDQSCCPSPLQSCCCNTGQISGLCRRSKRSIGRLLGLCGSNIR